MRTRPYTKKIAAVGAAALLMAIALLAGSKAAFALGASQTVFCQGTITNTTDASAIPMGPFFSVGNVVVNHSNGDCATTTTTVTQVINGASGPSVTTMTESNSVPLSTKGCGPGAQTPGITVSNITASSNPDLVGCSATSVADVFKSQTGAYTMTITPNAASLASCKAAGTGGITLCTSSQ